MRRYRARWRGEGEPEARGRGINEGDKLRGASFGIGSVLEAGRLEFEGFGRGLEEGKEERLLEELGGTDRRKWISGEEDFFLRADAEEEKDTTEVEDPFRRANNGEEEAAFDCFPLFWHF